MNTKKENWFFKYLVFATIVIYIAQFIFTGKLAKLTAAFKPFIIACIFVYLFGPLVDYLHKKTKLSRVWSVIISYIAFIFIITLFILMILPSLTESVRQLINNISSYNEKQIINLIQSIPIISNYIDSSKFSLFLSNFEQFIIDYSSNILKYSSNVISSIGSFLSSVLVLVFALLMSFYALKDTDNISEKIEDIINAFLSEKIASQVVRIAKLTDTAIKKYLIGKLYTCLILGILIGLSITIVNITTPLHIPYAPLIAVVIGLSNLIPYVGAIIGTVPCLLMALLSGFWEAVVLLLIVIIVQQIDNIIVTPKIIGDSMGLKAFWVIVSITVGGSLFGVIGMIFSVPFVSVLLYLVDEKVKAYRLKIEKKDKLLDE